MITLEKEEKLILEVRKHWFVLLAESFFLVFLFLVPFLLHIAFEYFHLSEIVLIEGNAFFIFSYLTSIWLLFVWISFFVIWTDYYLDVLMVTSKKIIDIEQKGLFSREVSSFRLDRIQDITVDVNGFIPTLFNFGDIHIQTAGERREFIARGIPRPYEVKEFISEEYGQAIEKARTVKIAQD